MLGYLICVGVGAFVCEYAYTFFRIHSVCESPEDNMVAALINASLSITVPGAVLNVGPILWLGKLLDRRANGTAV